MKTMTCRELGGTCDQQFWAGCPLSTQTCH